MDILGKYEDFGANLQALTEEARRAGLTRTIQNVSRPSKWDLIIAAYNPAIAGIRLGAPWLFRNPRLISQLAGKGFGDMPKIAPSKVFRSKFEAKAAQQ